MGCFQRPRVAPQTARREGIARSHAGGSACEGPPTGRTSGAATRLGDRRGAHIAKLLAGCSTSGTHPGVGCQRVPDRGDEAAIRAPLAPVSGIGCRWGSDRSAGSAIRAPLAPVSGIGCRWGSDRSAGRAIRVLVAPIVALGADGCRIARARWLFGSLWHPFLALGADGVRIGRPCFLFGRWWHPMLRWVPKDAR